MLRTVQLLAAFTLLVLGLLPPAEIGARQPADVPDTLALLAQAAASGVEAKLLAYDPQRQLPGILHKSPARDLEQHFLEVSNLSSRAAAITWITATPMVGQVHYGPTEALGYLAEEHSAAQIHCVWLTGLAADQEVFFRVEGSPESARPGRFRTGRIAAGLPRSVHGVLPKLPALEAGRSPVIVKLILASRNEASQPLAVRAAADQRWLLNLGNLRAESGEVFPYRDDMLARIRIEGLGSGNRPQVLAEYEVKLAGAADGDLSLPGPGSRRATPTQVAAPWQAKGYTAEDRFTLTQVSEDRSLWPERRFLEDLLAQGTQARRANRQGHGRPHIIPGWRGGNRMVGTGFLPATHPAPERLQLQGDRVLREILRLRAQSPAARQFFPNVGRHFPGLQAKLGRESHPVSLHEGLNIFALPLAPYEPVSSFSFLEANPSAQELVAWDGALQQFGASALRVDGQIVGDDFPLHLGFGYFVRMSADAPATFEGDPLFYPAYVPTPVGLELVSLVGGPNGITSYTVFDELFTGGREICRINPAMQSYECAFQTGREVLGEEFPLVEGEGYFVRTDQANAFPEDHVAPALSIVAPANGGTIHTLQPYVDILFGDHELGLDPATFLCYVNGVDRTAQFTVDELGAIWQMTGENLLAEGPNVIDARVTDLLGNPSNIVSSFEVVIAPPPPDEHFVNGYVFRGDTWEPLAWVAVTVEGIPGVIFTDLEGHYVFPTPGLGEYRLDFDLEHFTYAQRHLLIEEGHGDEFVEDTYLSPKDSVETRISYEGGVAANSDASVFTSFPPEAVVEDIDVSAFNLDDAEDLPSPLPELSVFTYCVKFWPDAVEFADSAIVDQLNARGFEAGTPIPVGHYNPATLEWLDEGMAYVGQNDTWFDFRLLHFLSFCDINHPVMPGPGPAPTGGGGSGPPGGGCGNSGSPVHGYVQQKFGGSQISHDLPSFKSMGTPHGPTLHYASHTVSPHIVVDTETAGITSPQLPLYTGAQLNVAGRRFTGIIEASRDTTRQRIRFDGRGPNASLLPTGVYHYGDVLANFNYSEYATADSFGGPPLEGTGVWTDFPVGFRAFNWGDLFVDNLLESSCGAGWAVSGLQRLTLRPDGDAMISEGGGPSHLYERTFAAPILDIAVIATTTGNQPAIAYRLGNGIGGFGSLRTVTGMGTPLVAVATGDFDGDLDLDLAANTWYTSCNGFCGSLYTYCGNGSGGFSNQQKWAAGLEPCGIVVADFDHDLDLDIAVTNDSDGDISVRRNNGQGNFSSRYDYTSGLSNPRGITTGYFNADENLDLAITNHNASFITILFGDGAGAFGSRHDWTTGSRPYGIVTGDLDGDTDLDLATANYGGNNFSVLKNNGAGGFPSHQDYPVGTWARGIVLGDFDQDNDLDVAITNSYDADVSIYLNNGAGIFSNRHDLSVGGQPIAIVAADLDGDLFIDLVVANSGENDISILHGDGIGSFQDRYDYYMGPNPGSTANGMVTGNFNGDRYLDRFISQEGDKTTLIINPDANGYTRIYPDSSKAIFDIDGLQTIAVDRNGNTTTYQYDESDRLVTITYPGILEAQLSYNADGLLETLTDPAGRASHFVYDAQRNLIQVIEPDGAQTGYDYDENHLLTRITDPRGFETTYEYDANGYVTRIMAPDASTNEFLASDSFNTLNEDIAQGEGTPENLADPLYPDEIFNLFVNTHGDTNQIASSAYGRPTKKTDVLGRIWEHEYDDNGWVTKTIRPDGTYEAMTRTATGQVATRTESANGAVTTFRYDPVFDQLTMVVNALNDTTRYELDERGNTSRVIDALGNVTEHLHDSRGLLLWTINALGDSLVYHYDASGNLESLDNELGYTTYYEYDAAGNRTAMVDPLNHRTEYEYDAAGRLVKFIDPLLRTTEYLYEPGQAGGCCGSEASQDLLMAIVNAQGDTTHFGYDARGRQIAVIDPMGHRTESIYDDEGNLLRSIDAEGRWVAYGYDAVSNLISQTDSLGRTHAYEYDVRDHRVKEIAPPPLNYETHYVHDGADNLVALVNANGDSTTFGYDLLGRKIWERDALGRSEQHHYDRVGNEIWFLSAKGDSTFYTYNAVQRLVEKRYPVGQVVYDHDAEGNLLLVEDSDSKLAMTYDANNRLETVTTGNPSNPLDLQPVTTIEYEYDAAGQKVSMLAPGGDQTAYQYDAIGGLTSLNSTVAGLFEYERDPLGRVANLSRPNGTTTAYEYDATGRSLSILHAGSGGPLASLAYTYNAVGSVDTATDLDGISVYSYDVLDQLTGATHTNPLLPSPEFYTYDPVGNRLSSHLSASYSYDAANQLIADDQFDYVFDANGNMVEKEERATFDRWEYDYDYENRLIAARKYDLGVLPPSLEASYGFDGIGRRISMLVDGTIAVYVYDADNSAVVYDGLQSILLTYANGAGIDMTLAVAFGSLRYFYYADHLGSIVALTNEGADIVQRYSYDSFGVLKIIIADDFPNTYSYTGRELDLEWGVYYYRAREYCPSTGRFMQQDLLEGLLMNNSYHYVQNSPLNHTDPYGLKTYEEQCVDNLREQFEKLKDKTCGQMKGAAKIACQNVLDTKRQSIEPDCANPVDCPPGQTISRTTGQCIPRSECP